MSVEAPVPTNSDRTVNSGRTSAATTEASRTAPILRVSDLSVRFPKRYGDVRVLDGIDLEVRSSECVAVVGESGCGKSLLGLATLGLLPSGAVPSGSIEVSGRSIVSRRRRAANREAKKIRGTTISMVYQDATTSLNPGMTVGSQLGQSLSMSKRRRDVKDLLESVHLSDTERIAKSYPFELSGGQRQRALIALALARDPKIVVADEPTSALDVTIQAHIVELLRDLQSREGFALIFISHDLALVSQIATRVAVLYAGRVIEEGSVQDVLAFPRHPYTIGLLESSSSLEEGRRTLAQIPGRVPRPEEFSDGCRFAPPLRVRDGGMPREAGAAADRHGAGRVLPSPVTGRGVTAVESSRPPLVEMSGVTVRFAQRPPVIALADVSLSVQPGKVLGVIGESGSGKTTLARCLLGIVRPSAGMVRFGDQDLYSLKERDRFRLIGSQAALVFQDPRSSLNQRLRVGSIVGEPFVLHEPMSRTERRKRVAALLESVGLDPSLAGRSGRRLSGGQLQRVALARALALDPPLIVADEPTSALDVSVQAQILGLIDRLRAERPFAMVVVSHDMRIIRHLADEVIVMYAGRVVEYGSTDEVCVHGTHPYTQALLAAVPQLHKPLQVLDRVASSTVPRTGCPFANRCPRATSECAGDPVPVITSETGHYARCYHPEGAVAVAVASSTSKNPIPSEGE